MTQITLTSDQTAQLVNASDEVVITDSAGNVVVRLAGKISTEEAEIIAEAKRRLASDEPRIPFSDVVNKLNDRQAAEDGA